MPNATISDGIRTEIDTAPLVAPTTRTTHSTKGTAQRPMSVDVTELATVIDKTMFASDATPSTERSIDACIRMKVRPMATIAGMAAASSTAARLDGDAKLSVKTEKRITSPIKANKGP